MSHQEEQRIGVVKSIENDMAIVATARRGACESCSEKGLCFSLGKDEPNLIKAINRANAKIGDAVNLEIADGTTIKATFFLYFLPLLGLIAGAFAGSWLAAQSGWDTDLVSLLFGMIGFAIAISVSIVMDRVARKKRHYFPIVASITTDVKSCSLPEAD